MALYRKEPVWDEKSKNSSIKPGIGHRLSLIHIYITLDLFEYDPDGDCYDRYQEEFKERAYSHEQLKGMLDAADMDIVAVYGDDTFEMCIRDRT